MNKNYLMVALLAAATTTNAHIDVPTGTDLSIGEILYPSAHVSMAAGGADPGLEGLEFGGHDPNRDGFTLQGLEVDLSLRHEEYLQAFAAYNISWGGEDEEWVDEWEEIFAKLANLPGGLEARGGRMLTRFGARNALHHHSWSTVDQNLVNVRFLGEDGLAADGGDVTWYLPTPFTSALTLSYGEVRAHAHGHGGEEDEHGHEEDEHGHGEEEAEEILFEDEFVSANLVMKVNRDDFNQFTFGGSVAGGDNGFGDDTLLIGLNANYTWRENGLEPGGRQLSWTTEIMLRDFDVAGGHGHGDEEGGHDDDHAGEEDHDEGEEHHDEGEEEHHEDEESDLSGGEEWGAYTEVIYTPKDNLDVGVRLDYVEGIDSLGAQERVRISPVATLYLNEARNLQVRFQYNYDDVEHGEDVHSAWAQLQYSFGGGKEVR